MADANPRKKEVYEVLEIASKMKTVKEKAEYLSQQGMPVRDVCQAAFDDRVKFLLPTGKVPYKPAPEHSHPSTLLRKHRDFKYFVNSPEGKRLPAYKRESYFISTLEAIHPRDAEILVEIINKRPPMKGITKAVVKAAWPELGL